MAYIPFGTCWVVQCILFSANLAVMLLDRLQITGVLQKSPERTSEMNSSFPEDYLCGNLCSILLVTEEPSAQVDKSHFVDTLTLVSAITRGERQVCFTDRRRHRCPAGSSVFASSAVTHSNRDLSAVQLAVLLPADSGGKIRDVELSSNVDPERLLSTTTAGHTISPCPPNSSSSPSQF